MIKNQEVIVAVSSFAKRFKKNIEKSGLSIYTDIAVGDSNLWITTRELEYLLNDSLINISLSGLPLRTRSKVVKTKICNALGYPVPKTFIKTKPRFPGQNLDVYSQKSNNLQIWNEDIDPTRRYALIKVSESDIIEKVKVVEGTSLAILDTTGTLTQKYQATLRIKDDDSELISITDTINLLPLVVGKINNLKNYSPVDQPSIKSLIPIQTIFNKLKGLIGETFNYGGSLDERNRGGILHELISNKLGYANHLDDGSFPDIKNQLLEIKLQTSPTIDLGLVTPNSSDPLGLSNINGITIRHCDVRYAVFWGIVNDDKITLTNFYLTTGENFFTRFPQFQGKVLNKKIQIPLPRKFFD